MLFTDDPYEDIMKAFTIDHKSESVPTNPSDTNEDCQGFTLAVILGDIGKALVFLTAIAILIVSLFISPDKKELLFWIGMILFSIGSILIFIQDYLEGEFDGILR